MMQIETPFPPIREYPGMLPPPAGSMLNGPLSSTTTLPSISTVVPRPASEGSEDRRETRKRTKTGCLTCRKRRIKCDEEKPACRRCVKSKRCCEGYNNKAVFRNDSRYGASNGGGGGFHARHHSDSSASQLQFTQPYHYHHSSRNSSTSSASTGPGGRRISVQSLVTPQAFGQRPLPIVNAYAQRAAPSQTAHAAPSWRDEYFYDYFCREYAQQTSNMIPRSADVPYLLTQTIPQLIAEDPPSRRGLYDALVTYTAHVKHVELQCDWEIRSLGYWPRVLELGLKCFVDIIRGTTHTLDRLEETIFSPGEDEVRTFWRWGILVQVIVATLTDNLPRTAWVNYLAAKAFSKQAYQPRSEMEQFLVEALQHLASGQSTPSKRLLALGTQPGVMVQVGSPGKPATVAPAAWLQIPGCDLIYYAFARDHVALRNICYRVLATPSLGYVSLAHRMVSGAMRRGDRGLELLAQDLGASLEAF